MRRIIIGAMVSLDGVMQAPGGPEEDEHGRFDRGGWAHFDDDASAVMGQIYQRAEVFLFGRQTYEIFAAHWPYDEGPIADQLNSTRKHVASTTLEKAEWSDGRETAGYLSSRVKANEQLAERDLVATRKTLRGTHLGEIWHLPPTGNRVEFEFIDIFRVKDGKLVEHWTHMDFDALRLQMHPRDQA